MNLISVVNFIGETELVRADQIESIGLPVKDQSKETYIHGWVRLISGRAIGFAEGEAEKFVAAVQGQVKQPWLLQNGKGPLNDY